MPPGPREPSRSGWFLRAFLPTPGPGCRRDASPDVTSSLSSRGRPERHLQFQLLAIAFDYFRHFSQQLKSTAIMGFRLHHRGVCDRPLSGEPEVVDCLVFVVGTAEMVHEF